MRTPQELFRHYLLPVMRAVFKGYEVIEPEESGPRTVAVRKQLSSGLWAFWLVTWSGGVNAMELCCAISRDREIPEMEFDQAESNPDQPGYRSSDLPGTSHAMRYIPFKDLTPELGRNFHAGLKRQFNGLKEEAARIVDFLRQRDSDDDGTEDE